MELRVNGKDYTVHSEAGSTLLWVLRDELGLIATKFGCGIGVCGACVVHVDGVPTRACVTTLQAVLGREIRTLEGLPQGDRLHPVQEAFLEEQVHQCGYCQSGQIMTAVALLERNPEPSDEEITAAMSGVYCRCGTYVRIRRAVARAAARMAQSGEGV